MFKVDDRNSRTRFEICSKLTLKTLEQKHLRRSGVFLVNFEHNSHIIHILEMSLVNWYVQHELKTYLTLPLPNLSTVSTHPAAAPGTITLNDESEGILSCVSADIPCFSKRPNVSCCGDLPLK